MAGAACGFGYLAEPGHDDLLKMEAAILLAVGAGAIVLAGALRARDGARAEATRRFATLGRLLSVFGALLSTTAGLIHFAVIRQHFDEYWAYGAFFIAIGIFQLAWALAFAHGTRRWLLATGVVVNGLTAALWVTTRTIGSLVGPEAHEPVKAGFGDTLTTTFELLIVVTALVLWRKGVDWHRLHPQAYSTGTALVTEIVVAATAYGLFSAVGSAPFIPQAG